MLAHRFQRTQQGGHQGRTRLIRFGVVQAVSRQVQAGRLVATGREDAEVEADFPEYMSGKLTVKARDGKAKVRNLKVYEIKNN